MQDLLKLQLVGSSSLTRDQPSCIGSVDGVLATGPPGKSPQKFHFLRSCLPSQICPVSWVTEVGNIQPLLGRLLLTWVIPAVPGVWPYFNFEHANPSDHKSFTLE